MGYYTHDMFREMERRNLATFRKASDEFWQMVGDVELTPAILEARNNYVEDAQEARRLEEHRDYLIRTEANKLMAAC